MKKIEYKVETFHDPKELEWFLNKEGIVGEDIISISYAGSSSSNVYVQDRSESHYEILLVYKFNNK